MKGLLLRSVDREDLWVSGAVFTIPDDISNYPDACDLCEERVLKHDWSHMGCENYEINRNGNRFIITYVEDDEEHLIELSCDFVPIDTNLNETEKE